MNCPYGKMRLSGHFCVSPNYDRVGKMRILVLTASFKRSFKSLIRKAPQMEAKIADRLRLLPTYLLLLFNMLIIRCLTVSDSEV